MIGLELKFEENNKIIIAKREINENDLKNIKYEKNNNIKVYEIKKDKEYLIIGNNENEAVSYFINFLKINNINNEKLIKNIEKLNGVEND